MSEYNDFYYGWPAHGSHNPEPISDEPEGGTQAEGQGSASTPGTTEIANAESHTAPTTEQASGSSVPQPVARLPLIVLTPPSRADRPSVPIPIVPIRQPARHAQIEVDFPTPDASSSIEWSSESRSNLLRSGVTPETKVHDVIVWLEGDPNRDDLYVWSGRECRSGVRWESSKLVPWNPQRASMTLGELMYTERLAGQTRFLFELELQY